MNDKACEKARAELEEYLHDELCKEDALDIREHLETCEDCRSEFLVGKTLTEVVQRACKEHAPEDLRIQVMERLRTVQSTH